MGNLLLWIGGGAVALYFLMQKASAENLVFYPGAISNLSMTGINPSLTLQLQIQNTSNVDFVIAAIGGNLYANNTLIGNVSSFDSAGIPARSTRSVNLTIQLQTIGVVGDIINAITGGNYKTTLSLVGSVNANNLQLPLTITYQIG